MALEKSLYQVTYVFSLHRIGGVYENVRADPTTVDELSAHRIVLLFPRFHELFSSDGIEETPKEHVHGIINIAFVSKYGATHGVTMGLRA